MLDEDVVLYEYEEILMGLKKNFTCTFKQGDAINKQEAGIIWQYAITNLLKWTPQEALVNLNDDVIKKLRLDKTYSYIGYFPKKNFYNGWAYILQFAFPDQIVYSFRDETIDEYQKMAKLGRWANDQNEYRYAKSFFLGADGIARAKIILNYAISLYLSDKTIKELYEFFGNIKKSKKWITGKALGPCIKMIYNTPLEYFHNSLPDEKKNVFYYQAEVLNQKYLDELAIMEKA